MLEKTQTDVWACSPSRIKPLNILLDLASPLLAILGDLYAQPSQQYSQ